jgi:hypothetical protein
MIECVLEEVLVQPGEKIKKYVGEKHYVPLDRLNENFDEENALKEVNWSNSLMTYKINF